VDAGGGALARRQQFKPEVVESLFLKPRQWHGSSGSGQDLRVVEIASLVHEIESSTSRISDLVGAIKEYTHMDQAPVQNVDVIRSLEATLTI